MHFLRADLHFKRVPAMQQRRVQRLIEVRPRNRDVILEAPGHRPPNVMDHAQRGVAIALGVRDDAHGKQIVNLLEAGFLTEHFAVHGIEAFHASFQFRGNAGFYQPRADGCLHLVQEFFMKGCFVANFFLQCKEPFRLEIAEG